MELEFERKFRVRDIDLKIISIYGVVKIMYSGEIV